VSAVGCSVSLDRLHQAGELTDEEFTAEKRHLLES
jgi:hypothetical protein